MSFKTIVDNTNSKKKPASNVTANRSVPDVCKDGNTGSKILSVNPRPMSIAGKANTPIGPTRIMQRLSCHDSLSF